MEETLKKLKVSRKEDVGDFFQVEKVVGR